MPPATDPDAAALDAAIEGAAQLLGLRLTQAQRPGVRHYFALAAAMARQVEGLPLTAADESGSVFVPVSPEAAP